MAEFRADHPFHFFIRDNSTSAMLVMGRIADPRHAENKVVPRAATGEPLPGDADGDDDVDLGDFATLADNFGSAGAAWEDGDFDGDGFVRFADFAILSDNFGKALQPAMAPTLSAAPTSSETTERLAASAVSLADDLFKRLDSGLSLDALLS